MGEGCVDKERGHGEGGVRMSQWEVAWDTPEGRGFTLLQPLAHPAQLFGEAEGLPPQLASLAGTRYHSILRLGYWMHMIHWWALQGGADGSC